MCGIAGVMILREGLRPPPLEQLNRMAGALRHRGPDEFGIYRDHGCGLAHARLSIIDLSSGQQPLSNEDGTLWTIFNGEIFNYLELRAELQALGHRFRTQSDTEVIVHAYEAWGERAFERFNGQFAVALWDALREVLVLARDPFGVRPLYICRHGDRLYFASEVKALFAADASIPRALDPLGLEETFTFWTVVPPRTLFQGVREVRPGCLQVWQGTACRESCFWHPTYPSSPEAHFSGSLEEAVAEVRAALEEAVRLRVVRADVPVGSYLSGGLDSSLVAALGRGVAGPRFQTFSLRFTDAEYDETAFQREMVRHLGSEHHEICVSPRDIAEVFPEVVCCTERPLLRTAPAPLFLLSRLVQRAGIKVVLTGEGADEMFAGYDLFREAKVRRFWAKQPASELRPRLLERLYPYMAASPVAQRGMARHFFGRELSRSREPGFSHAPRWSTTSALKRLFSAEQRAAVGTTDVVAELLAMLPGRFGEWSDLAQDQYLEVRTLLSGYLLSAQGDRMLMAHSVEGRFPFLDRKVVALANSLPARYMLRGMDEKHVLKRAAEGAVPAGIRGRPKQPYRAPDAAAFAGPDVPEWVAEVSSPAALAEAGLFDPEGAHALLRRCRARYGLAPFSNSDNMAVTGLLSTQLLHHQFVRCAPEPGAPVRVKTLVDALAK